MIISDSLDVLSSLEELLALLVGKTSSEVSFDQDSHIGEMVLQIDDFRRILNLSLVIQLLLAAGSHVVENRSLELCKFALVKWEIIHAVIKNQSSLSINLD